MDRKTVSALLLTLILLLPAATTMGHAQVTREHASQITHTFVNETGVPAFGLVVKLSHRSVVQLDEDSQAGPFRNFNGNDSTSVYLSNPVAPIDVGAAVEVVFRSYADSARIKRFWWTDVRGHRIGVKKKV